MMEQFRVTLTQTWDTIVQQVAYFVPRLVGGILILLLGLVIARLMRGLTVRFLVAIRLDRLAERLGIRAFLARGDVHYTLAEVFATVIYWLVLLFSFQVLGMVLGLEGVADFFAQILGYVPRLLVALVVLLVGVVVSSFFAAAVRVAAYHAGFPATRALGQAVKYLVIFFALVIALEQLHIATELLVNTLQIIIASVALAVALGLALAFGLGCKDLAQDAVRHWLEKAQKPEPGERPAAGPASDS